ncbi:MULTISPECIES: carboxylesterase family protein [unclassified Streptomyces]|uniref:carboxylesterase/lipase family protein n=1 Tax=unclassified Streptomyces TaxID=2593676 RepID=UPI0006F51968|nr:MULTISPECIES: carboxylesterase family protein [unclassified Streptomyces]KQX53177.1 acetylcholinesterase [Streptomyces sp. Root1304]KRA90098.1 acetylcholinesterase [Streptomyces sp. Root66D1]
MTLPARRLPALLRRARRVALPLAVAVAASLVPAGAAQAHDATGPTLVRTDNGWVRGAATAEGRQFLGIPYAEAPTGPLRLRAPQPASDWAGVRDATRYGAYCAQNTYWAPGFERQRTTEDCLDVNVYTPPAGRHSTTERPVMVWVHGGGNVGGTARDIVPDAFARRTGSIVVTLNYRLGALGFLTLPGAGGNFALLDQQQALRWVRTNIGAFGGDPGRVTLAGESAGGGAVCNQLASPASRGLYRGAIIMSGTFGNCAGTPREQAVASSLAFAAGLGCTDAATAADCLRAKSTKEILDAQASQRRSWGYTVGTPQLPVQPADAFASGRSSRVPVMNGATSKEGLVFAYDSFDRWGNPLTADAYPAALSATFGPEAGARALARYPLTAYERPAYAYGTAFGDQLFACPALAVDPLLAKRGKVYTYEFADRTSPLFASLPQNADFDFGATHAAELNYLFKPYGIAAPFNAEQRALADQMTDYWGSFVHGTPPRARGQRPMPEHGSRPGQVLQLRTASAGGNAPTATLSEQHNCDLWNASR